MCALKDHNTRSPVVRIITVLAAAVSSQTGAKALTASIAAQHTHARFSITFAFPRTCVRDSRHDPCAHRTGPSCWCCPHAACP
jgi:hypothetical protein